MQKGHYKEITTGDIVFYAVFGLVVLVALLSCSDDFYVGGYNKSLEQIDSTLYEKARKINTGY